jgi:hypothetical protein
MQPTESTERHHDSSEGTRLIEMVPTLSPQDLVSVEIKEART